MTTPRPLLSVLPAGLICFFAMPLANAATVTQTADFPFSDSALTLSASEQTISLPPQYSVSVAPFDSSLGTLESVVITWVFGADFSGTAGYESIGGSAGFSFGVTAFVDDVSYNGGGTGGGGGNFAGAAVVATGPDATVTKTFTAAGDGSQYPAGMWAVLSGNAAYDAILEFSSGSSFYYTNISSGTFTSNTGLTVDYNYIAAVPEPATLLSMSGLLGGGLLLRRRSKRGL